jgi:hypothetical protein
MSRHFSLSWPSWCRLGVPPRPAPWKVALFTGIAIIECESNSIPLLATLKIFETLHHGEVFVLILELVQVKSIKQLQAKHTS